MKTWPHCLFGCHPAFIRLRRNTLPIVGVKRKSRKRGRSEAKIPPSRAAGMNGKVNRAKAHQSEGGLISLYHSNIEMATAQFHFDTPPLSAGSFIIQDLPIRQKEISTDIITDQGDPNIPALPIC